MDLPAQMIHDKDVSIGQKEPSLHDSSLVIAQEKEQSIVPTPEIEALYRVEEDPAKPPLQVPVYLFANTSIEEVRSKEDGLKSPSNSESHGSPSNNDLLEEMKNQVLHSISGQIDDSRDSSVMSDMLVDDQVEMPEFLQSIGVHDDGQGPRQQIIAIIQDSDDENDLEVEENMSEEMLRFVVNADRLHTSGSPVQIIQETSSDHGQIMAMKESEDSQQNTSDHQVVIFANDELPVPTQNLTPNARLSQTIGSPVSCENGRKNTVMETPGINSRLLTETVTQKTNNDTLKLIPLEMAFEVVAEITSSDGRVFMREITTQTRPLRKMKPSRKRKLKDIADVSPELHTFDTSTIGGQEIINESSAVRSLDTQQKRFKCSKCGLKFYTEERCNIHLRCHQDSSKNYTCFFCGHTDTQWIKMYHHLFQHGVEKPHKCNQCTFTCVNRSDLSAHMAVHSKSKDWHCSKCGRPFKHRRNMVAHLRTCPGLDETGKPAQNLARDEKFVCGVCQKTLSTKKNLDKHMEIHLDVKPFICDQCGHSTRLKESLIMHKRLHTGEKPYKCNICDYATPDKSSLRRHNRIHSNDKPYKCQYCSYRCIQKHCLDTHVRRKHTGEQFVCGLCHYATHDRYGLNQHFKRHQNPDGSLVETIQDKDGENKNSAPTIITLPSGAVLTSTMCGKNTLIGEPPKSQPQIQNLNQVFLRIEGAVGTANTLKAGDQTATENGESEEPESSKGSKDEVATIELTRLETDLLQQIQQPGDEVFFQPTGEIVIRRRDGHLLVIRQQEGEEEATEFSTSDQDGQEYLTSLSPREISSPTANRLQEAAKNGADVAVDVVTTAERMDTESLSIKT